MSMLPRGTVRIVRNLQYSHLSLTLCIPLFLLGQCVLGVSGDDTIKAGKAASQMNKAITLALLRCQEENGSQRSLIGTPPQPCIGATEKQKLLRRDDVEKCINTFYFGWPLGDVSVNIILLVDFLKHIVRKVSAITRKRACSPFASRLRLLQ